MSENIDISMLDVEQMASLRELQQALVTDSVAVGMTAAGTEPARMLASPGAATSVAVGPMIIGIAMVASSGAKAEGREARREVFVDACGAAFDAAQRIISENPEQWACAVEEFRAHWHGEETDGDEDETEKK